MAGVIPDTETRELECDRAWRSSIEDDLARKAKQKFARFKNVSHVPVFCEHTTKRMVSGPDGQREESVVYDRNALVDVLNRCNHRILDTGDFSPITEGHTPDKESLDKGARMPRVLGYSGPFRLGMIGNENPRWAIFADEHHSPEHAELLRNELNRRSPEIWMEERMADRFFDPIAALGAETPRLDMGMTRYHRTTHDGREVLKYSATAPGAMNTFLPSHGDDEDRQRYEGNMTGQVDSNLVTQIVDTLFETDLFQKLQTLVGDGPQPTTQPTDEPSSPEATPMHDPTPDAPPAAPPAPPAPEAKPDDLDDYMARYAAGDADGDELMEYASRRKSRAKKRYECDDEDREMFSRYEAGEVDDDELMEYAAGKRAKYQAEQEGEVNEQDPPPTPGEGNVSDVKYAKENAVDKDRYQRLRRENEELKQRLDKIDTDRQHEKARVERYSRLSDAQRDGIDLDLDEEKARCDPAKMSDEAFEDHMLVVNERYSRIPLARTIPIFGNDSKAKGTRDNPTKEQCERATKYSLANKVSFEAGLEHVFEQDGKQATVA